MLTDEQKAVFDQTYNVCKESVLALLKADGNTDFLMISLTVTAVIKHVEKSVLKGADKKAIAIELGRQLIKDAVQNETKEQQILLLYDTLVSGMIDSLIDLASNVNVRIQEHKQVEEHKAEESKTEQVSKPPKTCCTVM